MSAATITALCTGIGGVISSVTALVSLFVHARNPGAHHGKGTS
jgi:hypothetical protein